MPFIDEYGNWKLTVLALVIMGVFKTSHLRRMRKITERNETVEAARQSPTG